MACSKIFCSKISFHLTPQSKTAQNAARAALTALLVGGVAVAILAILVKTGPFSPLANFPYKAILLASGTGVAVLSAILLTITEVSRRHLARIEQTANSKNEEASSTEAPVDAAKESANDETPTDNDDGKESAATHTCKHEKYDNEYVRGDKTAYQKMLTQTKYALKQEESKKKSKLNDDSTLGGFKVEKLDVVLEPFIFTSGNINSTREAGQTTKEEAGLAWTQGTYYRRTEMEDAHLATSIELKIGSKSYSGRLFGVFDGHGDNGKAAEYVANNLSKKLHEFVSNTNYQTLDDIIPRAFTKAFHALNEELIQKKTGGTCAVCALEIGDHIYFPNCGDSRAILIRDDCGVQMTEDARPTEDRFSHRVMNSFENVVLWGRVGGELAVARDLGEKIVSARPKVAVATKSTQPDDPNNGVVHYKKGDIVVLACDGLWDVATTEEVAEEVRRMQKQNLSLMQIAANLTNAALHSNDNISVIVFKAG